MRQIKAYNKREIVKNYYNETERLLKVDTFPSVDTLKFPIKYLCTENIYVHMLR